ncbi:MAG TPA: M23 family metallopeptidase, partial [Thermomicrobiales bacterium]|nr:M23 family metallopeptidase [Thermomicrobiales bacterium]
GVALIAALDGREQLATPPETARLGSLEDGAEAGDAAKTARLATPRPVSTAKDRRRMEVSTVTRVGDRDVIRTVPFVQIKMALAAGHTTTRSYPPFDPLEIFAEDGAVQTANTGLIYGAKVESEVSLKTVDFPIETAAFDQRNFLSADEVEKVVRETSAILTDGDVQVAALHYVDPQRFGETFSAQTIAASYGVRIVPENVSVAPLESGNDDFAPAFAEEIIPIREETPIADAFTRSGYRGDDALGMADALAKLLNTRALKAGTVLRIGIETRGEVGRVVRASIYAGAQHLLTIALNDRQQFVPSDEPEPNPEVAVAFEDAPQPVRVRGDLPPVYDGIYRAAYSYGMSSRMTKQLVKLLASEVDFQSRLNPADRVEVFFSQPDENGHASEESELLYVKTNFGGNLRTFYRFRMDDGTIDYFDQEGRSARQFLLRNPVPNGRFTSGFGGRRHPILGYTRMHTGADWSAPRGTPILATGNGVVEKAGWSGGYGRQTIIRHPNGYQTSYNHQNSIARGVVPGAKVRQGQVIGHVGSTGLSTGAHLHYELMVNGAKVDPMRVRLPVGKVLKGAELEAFNRERERIDILLADEGEKNPLALANLPATVSVVPELLIRNP